MSLPAEGEREGERDMRISLWMTRLEARLEGIAMVTSTLLGAAWPLTGRNRHAGPWPGSLFSPANTRRTGRPALFR